MKECSILDSNGKPIASSDELDFIKFNDRLKSLEKFKNNFIWILSISGLSILTIACFFYTKVSKLNTQINEAKNQYTLLENSYKKLQSNLLESDKKLKHSKEEFLRFCQETKNIADIAKINAETALAKAGLLNEAINAAQAAANRSAEANIKTQEKIIEFKKIDSAVKDAYLGICQTQRNLEAFLSKNLDLKQPKQFKVKTSGSYCNITIIKGDGIAYDRVISGSTSQDLIVVPENITVIIEDTGNSNNFFISDSIKSNVVITGCGRYRTLKIIK